MYTIWELASPRTSEKLKFSSLTKLLYLPQPVLLKTLKSKIFFADARQLLQSTEYENVHLHGVLKTTNSQIFLTDAR